VALRKGKYDAYRSMSDRLLARIIHDGSSRNFGVARDGLKAED
jgi:hypothetical protein